MPGEAGVPPRIRLVKLDQPGKRKVLYPAPKRFTDKSGDTIGYKGNVLFPVRLKPKDASKPIDVHLAFDYGVCKDICIPAEAELTLNVAPDTGQAASDVFADAMARVPAPPDARRETDPVLKRTVVELTGAKPRLLLETQFPDGAEHADAFVEAPDGLYVPLPKKIADDGKGAVTFEIDLSKDADVAALKGKQLTRDDRVRQGPVGGRLSRFSRANAPRPQFVVSKANQPKRGQPMTIKVGDKLPDAGFMVMTADGPAKKPPPRSSPARKWRCSPCRAPTRRPANSSTCRASCRASTS